MNFNQLNLKPEIVRAVEEKGYTEPTTIQEQAIPLILSGKDMIAQSQTGTGKTAAFGLPFLSLLETSNDSKRSPQMLVLTPTRELAVQVADEIQSFAKYLPGVRVVRIYGGEPIFKQINALRNGADVVVATPGRLLDHIRRRTLRFQDCKALVLDEADEMLNMGFLPDIKSILESLPTERQTVLFSATMPKLVKELGETILRDPEMLKMKSDGLTVSRISQHYIMIDQRDKEAALLTLLRAYTDKKTIVFCNTKRQVDRGVEIMESQNMIAMGIHGDMKQEQRIQVLERFHKHSNAVVFATDVLARGIDVENLDLVINYDIPQENEFYVHRIGRTGRKGNSGMAITLINRRQRGQLNQLIRHTKATIDEMQLPSAKTLLERSMVLEAAKIKANQEIKNEELFQQVVNLMTKNDVSQEEMLLFYFNSLVKEISEIQPPKTGEQARRSGGNRRDGGRSGSREGSRGGYRGSREGSRGGSREGSRGGSREGSRGGSREGSRGGSRDGARSGSRDGYRGNRDNRGGSRNESGNQDA